MIDGVTLRLGGRDWIVPPLTLGQIKKLAPRIEALTQAGAAAFMGADQIDAMAEIVAAALARNYPEMTAEQALELLDAGNALAAYAAVLTGSGLRRGESGGDRALGEGEPVAISEPPSAASTEPSPPAAATPSP